MGIRGLTTFINNRSHLYLKNHELHDCNVVIDGNSLASNLYKWHCKSNDCFGGDYDKFAHVIRNFFELLAQCNITPYVILDGGYEKRKLNTVVSRMQNKIYSAHSLNALTEGSESVFPLFLREVFVDIVVSLEIKLARCEFEGDMEIASIAKVLECPVISYDSDFYIFGCLYIPFSTVEITARKGKDKLTKNSYTYLSCKIYHIESFLQVFGGLDKNNLPLLAVLLGNDYIKRSLFKPFFKNLKMQKYSCNQSDQQKRIKSVIVWLQNENIESAIKTVLSRFKTKRRKQILMKIESAMKGYFQLNSELLKYLNIKPTKIVNVQLDFDKLNSPDIADNVSDDSSDSSSESEAEEEFYNNDNLALSKVFCKNYRNCQYPACFMDFISLNKYYCIPQVENTSSEHSHVISLDILNIMYTILTPNSTKRLTVVHRNGREIKYVTLPRIENINTPTIEEIETFTVEKRKLLLLDFLKIDNKFSNLVYTFPMEWHLFLIALKFAIYSKQFDKSIIHSCIICFIILNYVDTKIGFHRVSKTFYKKYGTTLSEIKMEVVKEEFNNFNSMPTNQCLVFMEKMINYFQMDLKLKTNPKLYDKILVHSLSQLQSVFLHVKYLNSLLNNAFPILEIHNIFDGTFLYNMTINLRKRNNTLAYLELVLKDCPCMLGGIKYIFDTLGNVLESSECIMHPVRKHRKKKKKKVECTEVDDEEELVEEEVEIALDPNNPYSVLAVI